MFFKKLLVTPEWDEEEGRTSVRVTGAELTEPYAAVLAEDLVSEVMNEVEMIRATAGNAESGPREPLSDASCSIFFKLAEGGVCGCGT